MDVNEGYDWKLIKAIKYVIAFLFIYVFSGLTYYLVEIVYRGYSHWTMFVCAGVCGIGLALVNDVGYKFETDYRIQVGVGAALCTLSEFVIGEIFNRNYEIWDYRGLWGTLHVLDDQVNVVFIGAWIVIVIFAIPILDLVQWQLGIGKKPYYRIGKKYWYIWG